jgi:hypothetical protein
MNRQSTALVLLASLWVISPAFASTIAEIAAMPEGGHATSDTGILLSTTDLVGDPDYKSFQIRDLTRAMTIHGTNAEIDAALTTLAGAGFGVGEGIDISGYTDRLDGALVLTTGGSVSGFAVSGRTSTAPIPIGALHVLPSDITESYESNLVCLQNVLFDNNDGTFVAGSDYALAGGFASVRIATADLGLAGLAIPSGPLNITGIVIPAGGSSAGVYRLAPRGPGDIVSVPEPSTLVLVGVIGLIAWTWQRR